MFYTNHFFFRNECIQYNYSYKNPWLFVRIQSGRKFINRRLLSKWYNKKKICYIVKSHSLSNRCDISFINFLYCIDKYDNNIKNLIYIIKFKKE